jgi:hypothetical protein
VRSVAGSNHPPSYSSFPGLQVFSTIGGKHIVAIGGMEFWKIVDAVELSTIVGAIFAVLAVAVAIFFYYADRRRRNKALTAELTSVFSLLNRRVDTGGKELRVFLGTEPVDNLTISHIRILNSGGCPILGVDFELPLKLIFHDSQKIYFYSIKNRTPHGLEPVISAENNTIFVEPLLLNPGDNFLIEIGFDSYSPNRSDLYFQAIARIAGIHNITVIREYKFGLFDTTFWYYWPFGFIIIASLLTLSLSQILATLKSIRF